MRSSIDWILSERPLGFPLFIVFCLVGSLVSWDVAYGGDKGFRFKDGKCIDDQGQQGLNTLFFGQCSDLQGLILGRLDLSGIDFSGSKMGGTNFQGSDFDGAHFESVDLAGANLAGVSANGTAFIESDLTGVRFANAKLGGSQFLKSQLNDVVFSGADLSFSTFSNVGLMGALWANAEMPEVVFDNVQLGGAVFRGVNLKETQWINVDFRNGDLSEANLVGAVLAQVKAPGIAMGNVSARGAQVTMSDFSGGTLSGGQWDGSRWDTVTLKESALRSTGLSGSQISNCDLTLANLRGADFSASKISKTDFDKATYSKTSKFPFDTDTIKSLGMELVKLSGIGLFLDGNIVDYRPGNAASEAANLEAYLKDRQDYSSFVKKEGQEFLDILEEKSVVVIPELERTNLDLPKDSEDRLKSYLEEGGRLVVFGSFGRTTLTFLNAVFGWNIMDQGTDSQTFSASEIKGSFFKETGLDELPAAGNHYAVVTATLPDDAVKVFENGEKTSVFQIPYGQGWIIYLAYDWFDAAPVGNTDRGWLKTLDAAVAD